MNIFPAIDLLDKKAVRLLKGDYDKVTVFDENPLNVAKKFKEQGAEFLHLVDLNGAKSGEPVNFETIKTIREESGLFIEVGGGIRNIETARHYVSLGIDRIILGTAAVKDRAFLLEAIKEFGDKVAVGVDIKDGVVAINGWTEKSDKTVDEFFEDMQKIGVKNIICTDISKDGAMKGTNIKLYKHLSTKFKIDITASGGVSSIEDIKNLKELNIYGAIIGKAYYIGAIDLKTAIEVAKWLQKGLSPA